METFCIGSPFLFIKLIYNLLVKLKYDNSYLAVQLKLKNMAWVFTDNDGLAWVSHNKPTRSLHGWVCLSHGDFMLISMDLVEIILGRKLQRNSEPVEIVVKPKETNPIDISDALKDAYKGGFESATQVLLAAYEEIKTR